MTDKAKTKAAIVELGAGMGDFAEWCAQPDQTIQVERCSECPMHENVDIDCMICCAVDPEMVRMGPWDRRFPRWCPLLKAPITIAARRKGVGGESS